MRGVTPRLLLLNPGTPYRLLSIDPDGGDLQVLVDHFESAPDGIAFDILHNQVFMTFMGVARAGEDFWAADGSIERMDPDGTHREVVVPVGKIVTPKQIQCDAKHSLIYWCDREGLKVMRARTDGSEMKVLVQTGASEEERQDRRRHCVGVAVDPVGRILYWTQKGRPNGNEGQILRAPLDLPEGMDPGARTDVEVLFDGLPEPIDLEWDGESGYLYWTDRGDPPNGNTLNRTRVLDGRPMIGEIVLAGLNEGIGLALDRRNNRAFVSDLGGFVRRIQLDRPNHGEIIFSGHGLLTGIAYLDARSEEL